MSCKGGNTSGLLKHIVNKHGITLEPSTKKQKTGDQNESAAIAGPSNEQTQPMQTTLNKFVVRQTVAEKVAKLIAVDLIPPYTIVNSEFIRNSFQILNTDLPKYPDKVMDLMHQYYEVARKETGEILRTMKQKGNRFSITMDEWTSCHNRRYLNVNVHANDGKMFNLGLIRIIMKGDADTLKELMIQKLNEFELRENDIIGATTDAASVMCKLGRLMRSEHQQCYNHGIHLAVLDVLTVHASQIDTESDDDDNNDVDLDSIELDEDTNECDQSALGLPELAEEASVIKPNISFALNQVRKIVRMFRRSPVKNAVLQKYIKEKYRHELSLLLDVSTRWNSQEIMLNRFLDVYDCIKLALVELKSEQHFIDDVIPLLKDLLQALRPVKLAVEKLSSRDCDLLMSEGKGKCNIKLIFLFKLFFSFPYRRRFEISI